jgi:hypothetical protein
MTLLILGFGADPMFVFVNANSSDNVFFLARFFEVPNPKRKIRKNDEKVSRFSEGTASLRKEKMTGGVRSSLPTSIERSNIRKGKIRGT